MNILQSLNFKLDEFCSQAERTLLEVGRFYCNNLSKRKSVFWTKSPLQSVNLVSS